MIQKEIEIIVDFQEKGDSAYVVAVNNGFVGTELEWIASIKQPALDAAEVADAATLASKEQTELARIETENTVLATEATVLATGNADTAGEYANARGAFANTAGGYANAAGGFAEEKGRIAAEKAALAAVAITKTEAATQDSVVKTTLSVAVTTAANNASDKANAARGWTPLTVIVTDGIREVYQLIDYVGGTGIKPIENVGSYVSATGFTTVIANAKNIKGSEGLAGSSRIPVWSAGIYAINSSVLYLGKYWTSNAATVSTDIPGTSTKWREDLTAYSTPAWVKTITADDIANWNNSYRVYGTERDITAASTAKRRIGNLALHASLPVQSRMRRCVVKDDYSVTYYLDANNSNLKEDGTAANLTGADGQYMVEIPEHYFRYELEGNIERDFISLYYFPGATRVNKCYASAVKATVERSTLKLSSVVNTDVTYRGGNNNAANDGQPNTFLGRSASGVSRINFSTYAKNRGVSWTQLTYHIRKVFIRMFECEYANTNSQLPINNTLTTEGYRQGGLGNGVTDAVSGDHLAFSSYYSFIPCGITNSLGNKTGEVSYQPPGWPNITKVFTVNSYRGIENIFGETNDWNEGINIRKQSDDAGGKSMVYTAKDLAFSANDYMGYTFVGLEARVNGYIRERIAGEIIPSVISGASATTFFSDYHTGATVPAFGEGLYGLFSGGHSGNGGNAGLGCSNSSSAPSNTNAHIGSRLCCFPFGV